MSEAGPQVNGPSSPTGKYIDGIDPEDPEYIKNLQRPAEVKEDLQQMENRSRVSLVLNSQAFKEELEQVVEEQMRNGPYPASLIALQQITDLLLPHSKGSLGSLARASTVIPINDLRGVESLGFAKGEKLLRCKLAALYRLVDLCGWSYGISNHISARVSPETEHFLVNAYGMTYSEVTASSLLKVDVRGEVVELGSTQFGINRAGFSIHSALHQARPDLKCIVHLHSPAAVAVSAMKCGLLPLSQEALICGNISYHDYQGVAFEAEEREKLARNLGVHNKILILHNQGIVACGETVEEAFHFTFNVMSACEAQVKAIPLGLENIVTPSKEAQEQAFKVANQGGGGVESTGRKWKTGELEFEALMRSLDNSGYRTGYVYKMPMVKQEKKERSNSEVEIPPSSSSFTYVFDGDYEHSKYASPIKAAMDRHKKAYKAGWLTTPNTYKKTEVEEIGTTTPKKITKWVPEGDSPQRHGGTPIKIENPNQFAPQGSNPKEYRQKQKSIKKDYYEEKITAGPQSKILEGITWDEAQKAKDGHLSGAGDQLIVVGAASKGIIQRDHQHNAVVYRQYYAANPFENMSEAEMEQYQAEVQRRERGEPALAEEQVAVPTEEMLIPEQPQQPEIREPEVGGSRWHGHGGDVNGLFHDTRQSSSQSTPGPRTAREERLLAQLADQVVQTVIRDALSVVRRGKGQQTLTGIEPLHFLCNPYQMGSQFSSDFDNPDLFEAQNPAEPKDFCTNEADINLHQNSHHVKASKAHTNQFGKMESSRWGWADEEAAVGAATGEMRCPEVGASDPDEGFVNIQLNPIQLYHGQSESGTMKVRFSIRSTVRRRIRAELFRGGPIEEIYASVTEPVIEHFETDNSTVFDHCEVSTTEAIPEQNVTVKTRMRKVRQQPTVRLTSKQPSCIKLEDSVVPDLKERKVLIEQLENPAKCEAMSGIDANSAELRKHIGQHGEKCATIPQNTPNFPSNDETAEELDMDRIVSAEDRGLKNTPFSGKSVSAEDFDRSQFVFLESKASRSWKSHFPVLETALGGDEKSGELSNQNFSSSDGEPTCPAGGTSCRAGGSTSCRDLTTKTQGYRTQENAVSEGGEEFPGTSITSLPVTGLEDMEDDIKFADEDWDDEELEQMQKMMSLEIPSPGIHEKKAAAEKQKVPPLPAPHVKRFQSRKKKRTSLKQKLKRACPPLSPVREEFDGTVEEMEEMEAVMEETDDSFEQLLISAEDNLLVSPKKDEELDLKDFIGAAPVAAGEDFDYIPEISVSKGIDHPSSIGTVKCAEPTETGGIDYGPAVVISETSGIYDPHHKTIDHTCRGQMTGKHSFPTVSSSDEAEEDESSENCSSHLKSEEDSTGDPGDIQQIASIHFIESYLAKAKTVSTPDTLITTNIPSSEISQTDKVKTFREKNLPESGPVNVVRSASKASQSGESPSKKSFNQARSSETDHVTSTINTTEVKDRSAGTERTETNEMGFVQETVVAPEESFGYCRIPNTGFGGKINMDDFIPPNMTENVTDKVYTDKTWRNNLDDIVSFGKFQTNVDGKFQTNVDDIVPDGKFQTNVEDIVPPGKFETNVDDIVPDGKFETNVDDIVPSGKFETNVDDIVPSGKFETNVDDIVPSGKFETNVDDIVPPGKFQTNVDDIVPSGKFETNVDDIVPHGKFQTNVDDIVPYGKFETNVDDIVPVGKFETTVDNDCANVKFETKMDDIVQSGKVGKETSANKEHKDAVPSSKRMEANVNGISHISKKTLSLEDDRPIQTSSPKLARARTKDDSFKAYHRSLGKSEETLLNIMSLESRKLKIAAKSQEKLEHASDEDNLRRPLSRTASLGPHHVNRKKRKRAVSPLVVNTKSKETAIDDVLEQDIVRKECVSSPIAVLDRYHLMKHNEMMELSSARSVFKPPVVVAYPVTRDIMPLLPDTTEVPSISDTEGRRQHAQQSDLSQTWRLASSREPTRQRPAGEMTRRRTWVPKQKRDRKKHQDREGDSSKDSSLPPVESERGWKVEGREHHRDRGTGEREERNPDYRRKRENERRDRELYGGEEGRTDRRRDEEYGRGEFRTRRKDPDREQSMKDEKDSGSDASSHRDARTRHRDQKYKPEQKKVRRDEFVRHGKIKDSQAGKRKAGNPDLPSQAEYAEGLVEELKEKLEDQARKVEAEIARDGQQAEPSNRGTHVPEGMDSSYKDKLHQPYGTSHGLLKNKYESEEFKEQIPRKDGDGDMYDRNRARQREEREKKFNYEKDGQGYQEQRRQISEQGQGRALGEDRNQGREVGSRKEDKSDRKHFSGQRGLGKDESEIRVYSREERSHRRKEKQKQRRGDNVDRNTRPSNLESDVKLEVRGQGKKTLNQKSGNVVEKELSPFDKFLNSPRMEVDVEKSPRLNRRRGGAIAPPDDNDRQKGKERRTKSDSREPTKERSGRERDRRSNIVQASLDESLLGANLRDPKLTVMTRSDTSLAESTHSRRSRSASPRIFENSPEELPPVPQIDPLTGEPFLFFHPLLEAPTENLHYLERHGSFKMSSTSEISTSATQKSVTERPENDRLKEEETLKEGKPRQGEPPVERTLQVNIQTLEYEPVKVRHSDETSPKDRSKQEKHKSEGVEMVKKPEAKDWQSREQGTVQAKPRSEEFFSAEPESPVVRLEQEVSTISIPTPVVQPMEQVPALEMVVHRQKQRDTVEQNPPKQKKHPKRKHREDQPRKCEQGSHEGKVHVAQSKETGHQEKMSPGIQARRMKPLQETFPGHGKPYEKLREEMLKRDQSETSIDDIVHSGKFETNIDDTVHSGKFETNVDDIVHSGKFETSVDDLKPSGHFETNVHDIVPPGKFETNVDDIVRPGKFETNVDDIVRPGKFETNVDDIVRPGKFETNVDDIVRPGKFETNVDDIVRPGKFETNVDDIVRPGKFETNVDDIVRPGKFETNVDDIVRPGKFETNVNDIVRPGKFETNVDDIVPPGKFETNVDDIVPPGKFETNVDDFVLPGKFETNVDDIVPPGKFETNVDDIVRPGKFETNVDDIVPPGKFETNVDDFVLPGKFETSVGNDGADAKFETKVDDIRLGIPNVKPEENKRMKDLTEESHLQKSLEKSVVKDRKLEEPQREEGFQRPDIKQPRVRESLKELRRYDTEEPLRDRERPEEFRSPDTEEPLRDRERPEEFRSPDTEEPLRDRERPEEFRSPDTEEPLRDRERPEEFRSPDTEEPFRDRERPEEFRSPDTEEPLRDRERPEEFRSPDTEEPLRDRERPEEFRSPDTEEPLRDRERPEEFRSPDREEPLRDRERPEEFRSPDTEEPLRDRERPEEFRSPDTEEPLRDRERPKEFRSPDTEEPLRDRERPEEFRSPDTEEPLRDRERPEEFRSPDTEEPLRDRERPEESRRDEDEEPRRDRNKRGESRRDEESSRDKNRPEEFRLEEESPRPGRRLVEYRRGDGEDSHIFRNRRGEFRTGEEENSSRPRNRQKEFRRDEDGKPDRDKNRGEEFRRCEEKEHHRERQRQKEFRRDEEEESSSYRKSPEIFRRGEEESHGKKFSYDNRRHKDDLDRERARRNEFKRSEAESPVERQRGKSWRHEEERHSERPKHLLGKRERETQKEQSNQEEGGGPEKTDYLPARDRPGRSLDREKHKNEKVLVECPEEENLRRQKMHEEFPGESDGQSRWRKSGRDGPENAGPIRDRTEEKGRTSDKDFPGMLRDENLNFIPDPTAFPRRENKSEPMRYAGFVKGTGRNSGRRSHPITGNLPDDDESADDKKSESRRHSLGSLIDENPLELALENNPDREKEEEVGSASPKKGLFSLFSCVGGRSAEAAKRSQKSKKMAYYVEGEKRKIKKLAKDKAKAEKSSLYFEKSEEDQGVEAEVAVVKADEQEPSSDLASETEAEAEKLDMDFELEKSDSKTSEAKEAEALDSPTPLLTFVDPAFDIFAEKGEQGQEELTTTSRSRRWAGVRMPSLAEEFSLSNFRSSRQESHAGTFSSFGKCNIDARGAESTVDTFKQGKPTSGLDNLGLSGQTVDSDMMRKIKQSPSMDDTAVCSFTDGLKAEQLITRSDRTSDLRPRLSNIPDGSQNVNTRVMSSPTDFNVISSGIASVWGSGRVTSSGEENIKPFDQYDLDNFPPPPDDHDDNDEDEEEERPMPLPHPLPPPPKDFNSSDDSEMEEVNSSAPPHFSVNGHQLTDQKHIFGPAHGQIDHIDGSSRLDSSLDQPSFDSADIQYRRRYRAVSFDAGISHRRLSDVSGKIDPVAGRPRSNSTTSNPLMNDPWRSKSQTRRKQSWSVSDMVYARGVPRPRRSHSIGEIYNSTVASGVARRRSRVASNDITSRMYQPRQRSRSRASLGDTSFGSVAPVRQRSFSGLEHSASHSEATAIAAAVKRSESERQPSRNPQMVEQQDAKSVERAKSDRRPQLREELGQDKPASPSKSDTLRSTDSASGGETLEERSSKEGSPTKEHPSPTKEKKKKKKFRIPSFSKKKNKDKENRESAI